MTCQNNQPTCETHNDGAGYIVVIVLYILLAIILGSLFIY